MANRRGDVIIEFITVGSYVKVTAVCTATGIEASIVGNPAAGEAALKQAATRKLDYVLRKQNEKTRRPGGGASGLDKTV